MRSIYALGLLSSLALCTRLIISRILEESLVTFTPSASEACLEQKHFCSNQEAYFAALNEQDNVVNTLLHVDLTSRGTEGGGDDDATFLAWYQDLKEKLKGLAQYPTFHSMIAKAKKEKGEPYIWCEMETRVDDHLSLETLQAHDPSEDVLSMLGDLNYGEYFDKKRPRWHVHVYRYTDIGDNTKTEAVFVLLRSGHALADGVSLVSMLINSVFDEAPPKGLQKNASLFAPPVVAEIAAQYGSKRPVQIARLQLPLQDMKLIYKALTKLWTQNNETVRVTLTTLVQTAVLRVLARMKQKNNLRLTMPTDDRGAGLNRLRTAAGFKKVAAAYADALLDWGPTNLAHGAAHQLASGCNGNDQSLEAWRVCYLKMQEALGDRYFGVAQDFIEEKFSVRARAKLYPLATKPASWLLSSMNAGPQSSSLAGANILSATVFLAAGNLFKRVVMLMTAGDMISLGIMAPEGREFALNLNKEILNLWSMVES